jgi:hypothetical protein
MTFSCKMTFSTVVVVGSGLLLTNNVEGRSIMGNIKDNTNPDSVSLYNLDTLMGGGAELFPNPKHPSTFMEYLHPATGYQHQNPDVCTLAPSMLIAR